MRVSQESGQSGWTGRGFRVKVNLSTFKDKMAKDTVTYHSWHWDVSVFCHSGWDDQHFFKCLQGSPGDLVKSLREDTTLGNILWMLDEHYGIVMTFNALSKKLYPTSRELERMWLSLEYICHNRFRYSRWKIQQEHMEEVKWDHFYEGLSPKCQQMLAHMVNGENPVTYCELLFAAWKLEK